MSAFPCSPKLRKVLAWLALCAMCFGAAAPTVSCWLVRAERAQELVAICDQHGITLVTPSQLAALQARAPDQAGDERIRHPAGHPSGGEGDACGYCTLIHHWPFMPMVAAAFAPHAPPRIARRVDTPVAAPALRAWRKPQMPQAPPPAFA